MKASEPNRKNTCTKVVVRRKSARNWERLGVRIYGARVTPPLKHDDAPMTQSLTHCSGTQAYQRNVSNREGNAHRLTKPKEEMQKEGDAET